MKKFRAPTLVSVSLNRENCKFFFFIHSIRWSREKKNYFYFLNWFSCSILCTGKTRVMYGNHLLLFRLEEKYSKQTLQLAPSMRDHIKYLMLRVLYEYRYQRVFRIFGGFIQTFVLTLIKRFRMMNVTTRWSFIRSYTSNNFCSTTLFSVLIHFVFAYIMIVNVVKSLFDFAFYSLQIQVHKYSNENL